MYRVPEAMYAKTQAYKFSDYIRNAFRSLYWETKQSNQMAEGSRPVMNLNKLTQNFQGLKWQFQFLNSLTIYYILIAVLKFDVVKTEKYDG